MDYAVDHALNRYMHHHPLAASITAGFADWAVTAFAVVACAIWLLDPPGRLPSWKRACASGLAAAALGLLANQLIGELWQRPRPYQAHPHGILPLLSPSLDPSFPSDHATAAFSIAFGILFLRRRAGWLFLAWAALIAASRVLTGMHYPTDVLAGAAIGLLAGYTVARWAQPLLLPLIGFASRITDPIVAWTRGRPLVQRTLLSPRVRTHLVLACGAVLLGVFTARIGTSHVLDEMPLAALAAWAAVVLGAAAIAHGLPLHFGGERDDRNSPAPSGRA